MELDTGTLLTVLTGVATLAASYGITQAKVAAVREMLGELKRSREAQGERLEQLKVDLAIASRDLDELAGRHRRRLTHANPEGGGE